MEESLKALKVQLDIDKIHGRKEETIAQEFYGKAAVYNITSMSQMYTEEMYGLGIFSVADPSDPDQFVPAGLLEYKGPRDSGEQEVYEVCADSTDDQPESKDAASGSSDSSKESDDKSFSECSEKTDLKSRSCSVLDNLNLIPQEVKLKGYEKPMAVPGVKSVEVKISPNDLVPKEGCRYAHKLSFSVMLGIVKKEIGQDCDCSADRIVHRSLHHQTGIKPGRPNTRTASKGRKASKDKGEFSHSETKMVPGLIT